MSKTLVIQESTGSDFAPAYRKFAAELAIAAKGGDKKAAQLLEDIQSGKKRIVPIVIEGTEHLKDDITKFFRSEDNILRGITSIAAAKIPAGTTFLPYYIQVVSADLDDAADVAQLRLAEWEPIQNSKNVGLRNGHFTFKADGKEVLKEKSMALLTHNQEDLRPGCMVNHNAEIVFPETKLEFEIDLLEATVLNTAGSPQKETTAVKLRLLGVGLES